MSSEAHLASLEEKHLALEAELANIMSRPQPQEDIVIDLKRKKLKLKDKMEMLKHTQN